MNPYLNNQPAYPNQGGYPNQAGGGYPNQAGGGYPNQAGGGYPNQAGGGGYPPYGMNNTNSPYPSGAGGMPNPDYSVNVGFGAGGSEYPPQIPSYSGGQQYPPPQNQYNQPAYPPQNQYNQPAYPPQNQYTQPAYPPNQYSQQPPSNYPPQNQYNQPSAYPADQYNPVPNTKPALYPDLSANNSNYNQAPPAATYIPATPQHEGTVKPFAPFNPNDDATKLYKAMKGFGTDETTLIDILCKRTIQQRMQIASSFKTQYGKDLINDVKKETSGDFHNLLKALLMQPAEFAAYEIHDALSGAGTDELALIDIVCTKSNQEMHELRDFYKRVYGKDMEREVRSDVSGYFQRILVSLMNGGRSTAPVDVGRAKQLAKELYDAGMNKVGTNEVKFNQIFAAESYAQLKCTFEEYYRLTGHDIEKAIKSEMSGDVERAFLAIARIANNAPAYFAQRLHDSMSGLGTKDRTLIRNIVLRCEIDMREIKIEFQKKYSKSLESFIKSDCSGDFKRALLCLIGSPNWK